MASSEDVQYKYTQPVTWDNSYVWRPVESIIRAELPPGGRLFELGCGSGAAARILDRLGYRVTAVDPSITGIEIARGLSPGAAFAVASAYDDLAKMYGTYPVVMSLEVIEHCYSPRAFARTVYDLLQPGGLAIISTPYHGYLKNLALALFGKFDDHWGPLWEGGHIKFWSEHTLARLLQETGFESTRFLRVGRIPPVAKSMIALARKPVA